MLKGRLIAVPSNSLSRRGMSVAIAAIVVGIAVPIAMLRAADEKPAEKLNSTATGLKPRHEGAQALFRRWQANARTDGKIPGGALRSLAGTVTNFIKLNPTDARVPKLTELQTRIDTSHDWTEVDAVALLDDLTAIYPGLANWPEFQVRFSAASPIRPGKPLPADLTGAAWGEPAANGLRAGWKLDPAMGQYPVGTNLKAQVLFHNTGKEMVVFQTPAWHQEGVHKARDASGANINIISTHWTTLVSLVTIRLAPGEFAEVEAHGIAIGPRNRDEVDWAGLRVGAWIEAKEGDEVTFQPAAVVASDELWTMPKDRRSPVQMWRAIVRERIEREGPNPPAAADREQLIRHVTLDLIGAPPTQEEIAAFVADNSPDALTALAERVVPRIAPFAGDLPAGEINFRVTAADPDAAKKPRTVTGPGRYKLSDNVRLEVSRRPIGERVVNEASIMFFSPDPKVDPPGKAVELKLPDGYDTWAAAWVRGEDTLWVQEQGGIRRYDFSNPVQVNEETAEPRKVPMQIRKALYGRIAVPNPKPIPK